MTLPDSLVLGEIVYKIVLRPGLASSHDSAACINFERLEIEMEPDIPPQRQELALLHEILHWCMRGEKMDDEENFVRRLEGKLYAALKRNNLWP